MSASYGMNPVSVSTAPSTTNQIGGGYDSGRKTFRTTWRSGTWDALAMKITASIDIFDTIEIPDIEYKVLGGAGVVPPNFDLAAGMGSLMTDGPEPEDNALTDVEIPGAPRTAAGPFAGLRLEPSTVKRPSTTNLAWRIKPKYEFPMLNFHDVLPEQNITAQKGMWHQKGRSPFSGSTGEGIFLSVSDIPPDGAASSNPGTAASQLGTIPYFGTGSIFHFAGQFMDKTGSLAEAIGIESTEKRLGR